ncbi:hypothetical protein V2J70_02195 [Pseudomonas alliivorans]|nr:hypothetical protein [Pseudomonas alliivorans]
MSEFSWAMVIIIASLQGVYFGYQIGRIRESNRWWTEVDYLRQENARQALMLKLMPKDEVKP